MFYTKAEKGHTFPYSKFPYSKFPNSNFSEFKVFEISNSKFFEFKVSEFKIFRIQSFRIQTFLNSKFYFSSKTTFHYRLFADSMICSRNATKYSTVWAIPNLWCRSLKSTSFIYKMMLEQVQKFLSKILQFC